MPRRRVAHVVYSWLPVTQNWIYTQLRCNRSFDHSVISMTEENASQFQWEPRYTAFMPRSLPGRLRLLMARYWFLQPDRFFQSTVRNVRPAVIHGHFATESWRILACARSAGIPLITTFYGLDVDKLPRRRFWKERYPQLFSYGACFLVEGPFMGKRLRAAGCPEEKIRIVPLGVDRELYRQPDSNAMHPGDGAVRILFTGLEREKKGPVDAAAVFCAAAKENPHLALDLVGDGPCRPAVRRILEEAGMLHRATFHGYLPFEKYRAMLAACDIVLVPSCYAADGDCEGGAPVVAIEAQVNGKPVVGTRHCDIPFVVVHGESGLLSAEHDRAAMTRDLISLAGNPSLRRRMGEQGKKHAAQQHDIHCQVGKLAAIYESVIRPPADGAPDDD